MKAFIYIFMVTLFSLPAYDVSASEAEAILISSYEQDVTDDGKPETIELYGIRFSSDSPYYRDIYAVIKSADSEWRINYQGGYNPTLQFVDLNHDGVVDMFYQSPTGGSGGLYTSRLDTLANDVLQSIDLPEQDYVKGQFAEGFQAVIEIAPNKKPIVMNVEERKADYIRLGIYSEDGKLLKDTSLIVDPIAFYEPVEISGRKGYGLKSYKQISGAYHADQLGVLETLWYYENGKWNVLQIDWKGAGEYDASTFY